MTTLSHMGGTTPAEIAICGLDMTTRQGESVTIGISWPPSLCMLRGNLRMYVLVLVLCRYLAHLVYRLRMIE